VLVPLDHAADLRLQVRLHAFGYPGATEQTLTVTVNGHAHGPVPILPPWHIAELVVKREAWRRGVNRISMDFAWERRPADVGLGGDSRLLAAAVDYVRISVVER
jgi:hypothetical protein